MAEAVQKYFSTEVTAPGKIIIFGEHSVVYGKKAIAGTLGLYTNARLIENGSNKITLQFQNINYEEAFELSAVDEYAQKVDKMNAADFLQSAEAVFFNFYTKHGKKTLTTAQRYSVLTFFQSYAYFYAPSTGFTLSVQSGVPLNSGAGSSASFSVVITAALSLFYLSKTNQLPEYIERGDPPESAPRITDKLKDLINERAYVCERVFHGEPSGIDHSVIIHGNTIEYLKGNRNNILRPIDGSVMNIILVDTKVSRSSKKQVEILKKLKDKYPETVLNILDAIGNISNEAIDLLANLKERNEDTPKHEARLSDLIELNHGLLRCVGLSHDTLEKVCDIAKNHGFRAKLTGAGGGGLAFVYVPYDTRPVSVRNLKDELFQAGFVTKKVILGGPGLKIAALSE